MKSYSIFFFGLVYVKCVGTSQYGGTSQDNGTCFNDMGIGRGRNEKHMYHRGSLSSSLSSLMIFQHVFVLSTFFQKERGVYCVYMFKIHESDTSGSYNQLIAL